MKTKISHLCRSSVSVILAVMMLLSTMLIGTVSTVNAATKNKFTEGETIYLDISSFTDWEQDNPTMYAYFYYFDTHHSVGGKIATTKVKDHIYSVTVPNAYCGYIKFQRGDSNMTAEHDADTKGSNNCVKVKGLDGNSEWSTYSATDSVQYYICGRFNTTWHDNPTANDPQFVEDESNPGLFYYKTGETIAQLSGTIEENYDNTPKGYPRYFYIYKKATNESIKYLTSGNDAGHNFQNNTKNSPLTLKSNTDTPPERLIRFNNGNDTSTAPVTIWLDTRDDKAYKLWYTTALPHTTPVAESVSLTASPSSVRVGTEVTLTASLTNKATDLNDTDVTYTFEKTSGETVTNTSTPTKNTYKFTPDKAGNYTFKVTASATNYSPVTSTVTVTATPEYRLIGNLSAINEEWNYYIKASEFDTAELDGSYSKEIIVTDNDVQSKFFKLIDSSNTRYGPNGNTQNVDICDFNNASNPYDTHKNDEKAFKFSKAGTYKIHYFVENAEDTPNVWVEEITTKYYTVTVPTDVSATVDKKTAAADETVTVTVTPETGKVLESVTVVGDKDNKTIEAKVIGNTATFVMPAQNVTVKEVKFRTANQYTVTFGSNNKDYGTVTAKNGTTSITTDTKVTEGDTVTFTAAPSSSSYTFTGWTVKVNGTSNTYTDSSLSLNITADTDVVANFNTGTLSTYYLLCGEDKTFKEYTPVPLIDNGNGVYTADFDATDITKDQDYFIIFSTAKDTSGIIDDNSDNIKIVDFPDNNGFSLGNYYENVYKIGVGTKGVKFARVNIKSSSTVTGFTIKITGLELTSKKITYSAEPKFDVVPSDTVEITAKDGTIREKFTDTNDGKSTAVLGDTTLSITTPDNTEIATSDSYMTDGENRAVTAKNVPKGSTVTVTTTIKPNADFAGHYGREYYVKGFSVNGIFGGVLSQTDGKSHSDNTYKYTFTVNQEIYDSSKLEITPVYFLKNDANCVYFYIENYDSAKQVWGNTPSCYVYYGSGAATLEALGYYPGQPMVDYNGSIFTQIPKSIGNGDTKASITGMTLNNYVWDDVHRDYNGKNQNDDNAQTYDYDDFVKIAESGADVGNIIYRFKYNGFDNEPKDKFKDSKADPDGWEVFLDYQNYPTDIFGNKIGNEKLDYKDTGKVTNKEKYLSIISDGYVKNYIGDYATSWSIYNTAGDRVANIPSSALLYALGKTEADMKKAIESESTPDDFLPGKGKSDRESYWETFKTLYKDYKDVPAQINFEASIIKGPNYGNRLDGRWYYSQSQQKITGEIKIQYANTLDDYKVGDFHNDTFDDDKSSSIVGTTTGASAYFTAPVDKVRKLVTVADNTQDYKFEVNATSTATYTFVGWYRLIDGDYKAINPSDVSSLTGAVTQNSDVTLVARYIKTPGGSMTFHHSLYNGTNAGGGKATTEIQVVVKNSEGAIIYNSGKIAGTASIDKTKIAELAQQTAQTELTVTVTLYTTTKNLYNFEGYYSAENTTNITPFTPTTQPTVSGDRTNGLETKLEYTFSFNDYYNEYAHILTAADAGTVYYNFYSDITSIKVPYKVQFSYIDRMGAQKYYNKAGYVDPENTSSYTIDETNSEGLNAVKVTLTNSFILSLAPYESNFTKNLTWKETPDSNIAFDSSKSNSIATAVVNSTPSDRTIHLSVYRDDKGDPTPRMNDAGKFVLYKKGDSTEFPYNSVFYTENSDGSYTYDITAPKTYTNNGEVLQFMYWEIYSDSEFNNLVIRAYNIGGGFSYASYDNYWIVPVYGESSTPSASVKDVYTTTQFMEVTRNQWTADNADSFTGFDADDMTTLDTYADFIKGNGEDKLYADFVLNFFYNGKQLSVFDPNSKKVQTGIVMQKLELEKDSTGVGYITDMKHYADKYTGDELSAAAEDAKSKILGKETTIESLTKQIDNSRLSNKNRIQYYARFNNTEANANCVYRVYTYIKYVNESNKTIIELGDPIYFTLYDVANKTV